jgi:hypothetical protein
VLGFLGRSFLYETFFKDDGWKMQLYFSVKNIVSIPKPTSSKSSKFSSNKNSSLKLIDPFYNFPINWNSFFRLIKYHVLSPSFNSKKIYHKAILFYQVVKKCIISCDIDK